MEKDKSKTESLALPPRTMTRCEVMSKRSLIFFNAISTVMGLTAVITSLVVQGNIGSYLQHVTVSEGNSERSLLTEFLAATPTAFLIMGGGLVSISLCGLFGAYWENLCMLKVYKISLFFILGGLLLLAILSFSYRSSLQKVTLLSLTNIFNTYNNNANVMDFIQRNLKCCGVNSSLDWEYNVQWRNTAKTKAELGEFTLGSMPVPDSCCVIRKNGCGLSNTVGNYVMHPKGCLSLLWKYISSNQITIAVIEVSICLFLIFCILFSCFTMRMVDETGDSTC